ncbi:MAG: lipopolysaccharide biosynthesis protein [Armatimonadota bacterium]
MPALQEKPVEHRPATEAEAAAAPAPELPVVERARTRVAGLNAASALLDYGCRGLVGLIVTPILVAGLGSSLFGAWQVLNKLVSYMAAADGRPTQALKWLIANQQSLDNPEQKRRQIGSAVGVWLLFLPVTLAVGALLVWLAPSLAKGAGSLHPVIRIACALLVLDFLFGGLAAVPEATLRGMNLGYKRMGIRSILIVLGGVLTVGAVYLGLGLLGVVAVQLLVTALTAGVFWQLVRRYVPWFGVERPDGAEIRSFLGFSSWYFCWTLVNKLLLASDVVLLGALTTAASVTTYVVSGYAATMVVDVLTLMVGAAAPGLGGLVGRKEHAAVTVVRSEMLAISWTIVTAAGFTILLWNRSFLSLWVGPAHYAGSWVNLLIVLMMAQLTFIRNDTYVIDLTLQLRAKVLLGAAGVAASLVLALLLVPRLGIAGLCLAMLLGRLVLTFTYPVVVHRSLGCAHRLNPGGVLRPLLIAACFYAGGWYFGQQLLVVNWLVWGLGAGATFAVVLLAAPLLGLPSGLRDSLLQRAWKLTRVRAGLAPPG